MSIEEPNTNTSAPGVNRPAEPAAPARRGGYRSIVAAAGVALALIAGAGAGAVAMNAMHPQDQQTLLPAVAITKMNDDSLVAIKGQVAEIFGNKFIITDSSGRALVDTGRAGEGSGLVKQGEEVTAQGRFDNGVVHASLLAHADGKVDELRAPPPPPPHGPGGPRGPMDPHGPGPGALRP